MESQSNAERAPKGGLLAFGPGYWGYMGNPASQLLSALARSGWDIVYALGALSIWDRGKAIWSDAAWGGTIKAIDGVRIYTAGRFPPRWERWNAWDDRVCAGYCKAATSALSEGDRKAAVIWHPRYAPYVRHLPDFKIVYNAGDAFSTQPGWTPRLAAMHEWLTERADLLLAGSAAVAELFPGDGSARAKILRAGVDSEAFMCSAERELPPELAEIPRPWIGYHGNLNAKIDFRLVRSIAERRPDWHWVLIGPLRENAMAEESPSTHAALQACRALPNIHFLGPRPYDEMARYAARMDVLGLIYDMSAGDWVRTAYPLKLHECLATGRPVVSVRMQEIRRHADVVAFADGDEAWVQALEHAILHGGVGSAADRQRVATENSWANRANDLDGWLSQMLGLR